MALPQFGIFAQGTHAHYFMEFDVSPDVSAESVTTSFRRLRSPDVTSGGVNFVLAFGSRIWGKVSPSKVPESLQDFQPIWDWR